MNPGFRSLLVLACALCALFTVTTSAQAAPPANDNIADALTLVPGVTSEVDATDADNALEPGELGPLSGTFGKTVWFKWTSPGYGEFSFSSCGSAFDTITSAYSDIYGNGLELYGPGARVDSSCPGGGGENLPTFAVGPGEVIFFQIGAYNFNNPTGVVQATLNFNPAPVNDHFADSIEIEDGDSLSGNNIASTTEGQEPNTPFTSYRSVWYHFEAPSNGEFSFNTCDANFDSVVTAYKGSALNGLTLATPSSYEDQGCMVGSGSNLQNVRVRAGDLIRLRVQGYTNNDTGTFTATLNFYPAPANDDFSEGTQLVGTSVSGAFSTDRAGKENNEPAGDRTVWFDYVPTANGYAIFDTCDTSGDTVTNVYTGNSLVSLNQLAQADGGCESGTGDKTNPITVSAYTHYRVRVRPYDSVSALSGTLNIAFEASPANDMWADATDLGSVSSVTVSDDNRYATADGMPLIGGSDRGASVWYRWTAPATDTYLIDTCDGPWTAFDAYLAVLTTNDPTPTAMNVAQVASDDDGCVGNREGFGRLSLSATAGQTYWIGFSAYSNGYTDFTLKISSPPQNTVAPVVSGANTLVGTQLSTTDGTWVGSSPITYEYGWLRCDTGGNNCAVIDGATSATYTLAGADDGHRIRSVVTATNVVNTVVRQSDASAVVDLDSDADGVSDDNDACPDDARDTGKSNGCPAEHVTITQEPTISGDRAIDSEDGLTLDPGEAANDPGNDSSVSDPVIDEIEWFRCTSPTDFLGTCEPRTASGPNERYVVEEDDLGGYIRAMVTWVNGDSNTNYEIAEAVPVYKISVGPRPSLSGTPQVGQTLTGNVGGAENQPATQSGDASPSVLATQWWFCDSATDEENCSMGPAGTTLVVPASAQGKFIRFGVIWTNGVHTRSEQSDASGQVTAAPVQPPNPPATPDPLNLGALKLPKKSSASKLVKAKGKFTIKTVQFACPAGGAACTIKLSYSAKVKKKSKKLGSGTLVIPAGTMKPLSGKLSAAGLKLLKKQKKLVATIAIIGSGGATGKATLKAFTVKK
jgi:hypothetical protein